MANVVILMHTRVGQLYTNLNLKCMGSKMQTALICMRYAYTHTIIITMVGVHMTFLNLSKLEDEEVKNLYNILLNREMIFHIFFQIGYRLDTLLILHMATLNSS